MVSFQSAGHYRRHYSGSTLSSSCGLSLPDPNGLYSNSDSGAIYEPDTSLTNHTGTNVTTDLAYFRSVHLLVIEGFPSFNTFHPVLS